MTTETITHNASPQGSGLGRDQTGMRAYNERLMLSILRRSDGLARAEIARETGLSAQTVSVIIRALERDGLLTSGAPIKGKVGQPLRPLSLAADGAYGLGLKIGRRSADLILMNIAGNVLAQTSEAYPFPTPERIERFVSAQLSTILKALPSEHLPRLAGLGVATPYFLWDWPEAADDEGAAMQAWRSQDIAGLLQPALDLPVFVENDGSAACAAELMFGAGAQHPSFLHLYVGAFVGGGIALNGALYRGPRGNAGAVGSMSVSHPDGGAAPLIDSASMLQLEKAVAALGLDARSLMALDAPWSTFEPQLDAWIRNCGGALAQTALGATALLDMPVVIIEGRFPAAIKQRLVVRVRNQIDRSDMRGLFRPEIVAGAVGADARAIGGACLPLLERFLLDHTGVEMRRVPPAAPQPTY